MSLSWRCVKSPATVCEHKTLQIGCPAGKLISIENAFYGRSERSTCNVGSKWMTNTRCSSRGASDRVEKLCNGEQNCKVIASNSFFGDPCVGTYKYMRLSWTCVESSETVCEHKTLQIECPAGKLISIGKAFYGRSERSTCVSPSMRSITCSSSGALDRVNQQCHGQQACKVAASNSFFGDPCVGTSKYLSVSYVCLAA